MSNQDPFTMTEDEWLDILNRTIAKDPEDQLRIMAATLLEEVFPMIEIGLTVGGVPQ